MNHGSSYLPCQPREQGALACNSHPETLSGETSGVAKTRVFQNSWSISQQGEGCSDSFLTVPACSCCLRAFAVQQGLAGCFLLSLCKTLGGQGLLVQLSVEETERVAHIITTWLASSRVASPQPPFCCCLSCCCKQPFDLQKKPEFWCLKSLMSISQLSFQFSLKGS